MCVFNAATVIRLTSKPILSAFFNHEGCLQQIDFNKAGLHEIQEAYGALPEQIRSRIEPILRNVFIFSTYILTRNVHMSHVKDNKIIF